MDLKAIKACSDEKLKCIERIKEFHPGYNAGIRRGWSYYVGGLGDHGNWYIDKLVAATDKELKECWEELIEESKPAPPLSKEDQELQNTWIITPRGAMTALDLKYFSELHEKREQFLLWGKQH